jgi:hypothetical protein
VHLGKKRTVTVRSILVSVAYLLVAECKTRFQSSGTLSAKTTALQFFDDCRTPRHLFS